MSVARSRCSSATTDFPFFFQRAHGEIAERVRAFAVDRLQDEEQHIGEEGPVGLEAERLRCRVLARKLAAEGLFGYCIPARAGGTQVGSPDAVDVRTLCLIREALGWASGVADVVFAMQGLGTYPIVLAGSDEQRDEFLRPVLKGDALAAFAITETDAGSDAAAMTTVAKRDGDHYVINGGKTFISNAGIAAHYVLFAKTSPEAGSKGVSAFIVKPDDPGFKFVGPIETLAEHPLGTLAFEDLRIPAHRRLGVEGDGFRIAMSTLDVFRSTVGAAAIGMARRALDEALQRAVTRRQFGKTLAEFQTTQVYLAEMATDIEAARLLVYRAAYTKDSGSERVTLEASMAKMFATEAAQRVIDLALQIHGGLGVVRGTTVERLYREVRALRIYEGTTEIQRVVISGMLTAGERMRQSDELRRRSSAELAAQSPGTADGSGRYSSIATGPDRKITASLRRVTPPENK